MNNSGRVIPAGAIIVFMVIYLAALGWLAILHQWTAFIIVAVICAPISSILWAIRSKQART